MHKHVSHNRCYASAKASSAAILTLLRHDVPGNWNISCDQVSDNFRVINPKGFRVLA
jgi:hypothetical protein